MIEMQRTSAIAVAAVFYSEFKVHMKKPYVWKIPESGFVLLF